ncbi:hypothetical protein MATL_G00260390 [Megalops atlanticus]|uniref:CWH43-like N-terminal domain-containing protein n=1 Tax=Megalops atlanticus TaxID=7932 RepID=A0A9D3SZ84_MEGAT|nr:hypothetical protein MATL_G00260390 [Megalops atlanticus]
MYWFSEGMCFLPTFLVIWSSSTFIISYIIALVRHDVDVIFPYISDTGADPPESGVFGVMTTVTAFTSMLTMYARYKFVQKLEEIQGFRSKLNKCALWIGLIACLGMCIVATFQVTLVTEVHDAGALVFFVCGVLYTLLQSVISYRMHPYGSSMALCHTRMVISIISVLASFPMIICAFFVPTKLHWDSHDKEFAFHLASAISEWIVTFCFVFFFFTYIREFKCFKLTLTADMLVN